MKTHAELYPGTDPNCPAILAPIEAGVRPLCDALNALPEALNDGFSGLIYSTPTSHKAIFNSDHKTKIDFLISQIEIEAVKVEEIIWWAYRVPPHNCIACDIYGAEGVDALNVNITITGETVIPSHPQEEPFEFQDETDAWCFLILLVEKFQLKYVKTASEGLGLRFSEREI